MASGRGVSQDPLDQITSLTRYFTVRASAIGVEDLAEDVGPVVSVDGCTGDRDTEFDGSADRVSNIGSKLGHGSCGVVWVVEELPFSHPGPAYMLWSLPSRADITYALLGPKSQISRRTCSGRAQSKTPLGETELGHPTVNDVMLASATQDRAASPPPAVRNIPLTAPGTALKIGQSAGLDVTKDGKKFRIELQVTSIAKASKADFANVTGGMRSKMWPTSTTCVDSWRQPTHATPTR